MMRLEKWDSTKHTELKRSQFETHRWAKSQWTLRPNLIRKFQVSKVSKVK